MKKLTLASLLTVGVLTLGACSEDSVDVSTGAEETENTQSEEVSGESQTEEKANEKKVPVNQSFDVNGLNVTIGEVKVMENKVIVGMTIKNTTDNKLSFYPDQGNVVVGSMQLEANLFGGTGDVGGEVHAGVEKSGVVEFDVPEGKTLNPEEVTEVQLHFGDIYNDTTYDAQPFDQTINLQ